MLTILWRISVVGLKNRLGQWSRLPFSLILITNQYGLNKFAGHDNQNQKNMFVYIINCVLQLR